MRDYLTAIASTIIMFLAAFGLLIGVPCVTDSTFGRRCAKAYPKDPAQQEWCVIRLNKGGTVYPKPANLEQPDE